MDYDGPGGYIGSDTSIDLDSGGFPHISYFFQANVSLRYAKWTGTAWSVETVDSSLDVGYYSSVALDSNDYPHISYHDNQYKDLKYARWNGSAWNFSTVDWTGSVGRWTSIALDGGDSPRISYSHTSDHRLKYAAWNGTSWNATEADPSYGLAHATSLVLDSSDNPHISYAQYPYGYVQYANWTGGKWNTKKVSAIGLGVGCDTSLALDKNGIPHISYPDYNGDTLKYAWWEAYGWNVSVVDKGGCSNSIEIDSNDSLHIAYVGEGGLKFASWTGGGWNIEIADSSIISGGFISLALDSDDNPHISYRDFINDTVKYATKAELAPPSHSLSLDIDPDTLNLKSKGRWISARLSAENASVHDIDVSTILLQDALAPERWDYQDEVLMLKFNRQDLIAILEVGESVEIKLSGKWKDGTVFEAFDYIRVINPGKK